MWKRGLSPFPHGPNCLFLHVWNIGFDKNFSNNLSLFPNIRILFGHLSLFLDSFGQIALHYLAITILFYIFTAK